MGTVLAVSSRALVDACARLGLETDAILAAAAIPRAELADPETRLTTLQADAVWQAAFARAGDPCLALHAAEAIPPGAYRVLHYLGAHSATVGQAFERLAAYIGLVDARMRLRVMTLEDRLRAVRFEVEGMASVPRPAAEFTLSALLLQTCGAIRLELYPARVDFEMPEPAEASEHRRVFRAPIRYEQRQTHICFDEATWSRPVPHADPVLGGMLTRHADALLAAVPRAEDLASRVREGAAQEIREGHPPSLAAVARRLALGARTLQRRLEEQGESFTSLVDTVRATSADRLLADPALSIAEVAWLLGFSEPSAFHRAFKRWTGRTPAAARRAAAPA